MKPQRQDLRVRTKQFALRVVSLYGALPSSTEAQVMGKQVLRSGTSIGAQYREAYRAKSNPDLINKLQGALQELEETTYWLELLEEAGIVSAALLAPLRQEADELTAIFVTVVKNLKDKKAS
jgi:four helix bundle protein